jgi:hypothetical protein
MAPFDAPSPCLSPMGNGGEEKEGAISPKDLLTFIKACGHEPQILDLG